MDQRVRQLKNYRRSRPFDSHEYRSGFTQALIDVRDRMGVTYSGDMHRDSGRHLRWSLGYQDALYYLSTNLNESLRLHTHESMGDKAERIIDVIKDKKGLLCKP